MKYMLQNYEKKLNSMHLTHLPTSISTKKHSSFQAVDNLYKHYI